jgi:hypothetical protein
MMGEVSALDHLTSSAFVVYLVEFIKGTARYRRWIDAAAIPASYVHVFLSAVGAFFTAVGMHLAVQGTSVSGWQITVAVPPLVVLLHATWDWAQQLALNQIVFALAVQQKAAAPVVTQQVTPKVSVTAALPDAIKP